MKCDELEKYGEEWLSGTTSPELDQHLEECPRCRQQAADLARTSRWLPLLRREPPEPGPAFWTRLRQRLEESERGADFWEALSWVASRAALELAAVVLLLGLGMLFESPAPAGADFEAPQTYGDDVATGIPVSNVPLNRDQVVLTLVAQTERQP